jgi:hypothetical protein
MSVPGPSSNAQNTRTGMQSRTKEPRLLAVTPANGRLSDLSPYEAQKRIDFLHSAPEKLVGLHIAPQPGLKVVLSAQA